MAYAVETFSLGMCYRTGFWHRRTEALRGLNLTVERNEIFGYLGANGAGKTTTLKILVGLLRPTSGTAKLLGQDCSNVPLRKRIGFMPEDPYFYEYLTAEEALHFYGRLLELPRRELRPRTDEMLELLDLLYARRTRLRNFSKGMRQRLGLAQALINDPELIILDEPLSGLDPMGRLQVRNVIRQLKDRGKTVLFSSHILSDVEMICDRVGILVRGKLSDVGGIDQLVSGGVKEIEVVAENVSPLVVEKAASLSSETFREGGRASFRVQDQHSVDELVRLISSNGGSICQVTPQRESLEEYFMRRSATEGDA